MGAKMILSDGMTLEQMAELLRPVPDEKDTYNGDGLLVCGTCGEKREKWVEVEGERLRCPRECTCRREKRVREEETKRRKDFETRFKQLRRDGVSDKKYLAWTFEQDDRRNAKVTNVCKKYVEHWPEMYRESMGILFYGEKGTGKSFLAGCIANALLEKLVPVCVTSLTRIMNQLQSERDKQTLIDRLDKYDLLVLDDLGVERDTDYAFEQMFAVVDARIRSGKPLIVTTNLTVEEMRRESEIKRGRIYDRIEEACPIKLSMTGASRRREIAAQKRRDALNLLGICNG